MFSRGQYIFAIIFAVVFIGIIIWSYVKDTKLHKYYYKNIWIIILGIIVSITLFATMTFWLHD